MNNSVLNYPTINNKEVVFPVVPDSFIGVNSSMEVSNYKWMTNSLLTAQQKSNVRPYFECKIVDDFIVGKSNLGTNIGPIKGSAVNAPDGAILSAGSDLSGNLKFWKLTDASDLTQWSSPTILDTGIIGNVSVNVSDYIAGTYSIDIYYFKTVTAKQNIYHQYSNDGGDTWHTDQVVNATQSSGNYYLSAGKPYLQDDNTIFRIVFYTKHNTYDSVCYQSYSGSGGTYSIETQWVFNTQDWTLHSLDSFYDGENYNIYFAGMHNWLESLPNKNYSIYTIQLQKITNSLTTDIWTDVGEILTSTSSSGDNYNSFIYPKTSFDGLYLRLIVQATLVDSVQSSLIANTSPATRATTVTNYFMFQSRDFINFTYPVPLILSDGTVFDFTGEYTLVPQVEHSYSSGFDFSTFDNSTFDEIPTPTSTYIFYTIGNGNLWRFEQSNITADITNSIINYSIQEQSGSPFSLSITLANGNNKWVGENPSGTGASAIAKNRKVFIYQGYYNSLGIGELTARNIFYIDDINQTVSANTNQVTIQARDLVKKLKVMTTKFTFDFNGYAVLSDDFDKNSLSNWNILSGTWNNTLGLYNTADATVTGTDEAILALNKESDISESSIFVTSVLMPSLDGQVLRLYPKYVDPGNWCCWEFSVETTNLRRQFKICINGFKTVIGSSYFANSAQYLGTVVPIMIRKHNYYIYDIIIGNNATDQIQTTTFDTASSPKPFVISDSGGEISIDAYFGSCPLVTGNFAIGCYSLSANLFGTKVYHFRYEKFGKYQGIEDLNRLLGTKAGIFDYKTSYTSDQENVGDFTGTLGDSIENILEVPAYSYILESSSNLANTELEITAKIPYKQSGVSNGLGFALRSSDMIGTYSYWINIYENSSGFVKVKLHLIDPSGVYLLSSSSVVGVYTDDYGVVPVMSSNLTDLKFDLTQYHTYKIVAIDQWISVFMDDKMVLCWQDSAKTGTLTTGFFGCLSQNIPMLVKSIKARTLYQHIESLSLNPGDDAETTLRNQAGIVRAWIYSDLFGRLNSKLLNSTDLQNYTYQNLLYSNNTDVSDKEYINQITVYGENGIVAVAKDSVSIANTGKVRDMDVTDYKITTYQDALNRANFELINANIFNNQHTPVYMNNVGSEIYDVVTIINTGDNSSGVNGDFRVYNEIIENAGASGKYSINIETGTL
jgi:hypothetical protein